MRGSGPRVLGQLLPAIARAALGKRGLGAAALLTEWSRIVGPELAAVTLPERLSTARGRSKGADREAGVLTIRASGGVAMELQYLAPVVVERINAFLGYRAVERIRLVQAPIPGPRPRLRPALPSLDAGEKEAISAVAAGVESDELREALGRLGRTLTARAKAPPAAR